MRGFDVEAVLENHEKKFLQRMNELRKENRCCDVSLNVKGEEFPCHKLVLITASSYFDTMFNGNFRESDSRRNITLEDIEPEAFEEILNAIYTGRFNLNRGNAYFILRSSHMLLLMDIFNTIVFRMESSSYVIDYLIETCLFARKIQHEQLYSVCVKEIAYNLENLCKTDSFNEKITYDIFNAILILKRDMSFDNSEIFRIVLRWNKHHKHSEDEILILLDSVEMENNFLSAPLMAKLIASSTNDDTNFTLSQNENAKKSASSSSSGSRDCPNFSENICHNVYLDVLDVKTGAHGWAILQSKDEFNHCEIIDYQGHCRLSKFSSMKVKKVGNKFYCLQYDENYTFFCIEDGRRIKLSPLPSNMLMGCCDIEALDNCLYLVTQSGEDLQLWMYDCLMNSWFNVPIENLPSASESSLGKRLYIRSFPTPKLTSYDGHLYIIVKRSNGYYSGIIRVNRRGGEFIQNIIDGPKKYYYENPSVCCYDKKLVLCGGSDRSMSPEKTVVEYDMVAKAWHGLDDMLLTRCNPLLNHHEGFLYAVENKWTVRNEKYDIKRGKWTYIPSLPERLYFAPENITLATGDVFSYAIE